jgi:Uma2 family endonuclease
MVQIPTKPLTLEQFLALPETKPATEYINGQGIQKPMPQGKHSILQGELVTAINQTLAKPKKIAFAFPELRCTFGGRSLVPDISIFTWARLPLDENGDIANSFLLPPDWVIEILSPDQSQTKVTNYILHCLSHGTSLGWLLDLKERSVLIFPPGQQPYIYTDPAALLAVPDFASSLQLTVGEMFSWLRA